jgi:hypothetical protein
MNWADWASGPDLAIFDVANGRCVGSAGHHFLQCAGCLVGVPPGVALLGVQSASPLARQGAP